jgi:hypothetical protein
MAPTDKIEVKAKFSLPFKPGMETEPGFVGKAMQVLKIYSPDKIETAQFLLTKSATVADWQATLKKTAEDCEKHGTTVFARNATGNKGIITLATKYNIKTKTGAGGLGKQAIEYAQSVFSYAMKQKDVTPEKAYATVIAMAAGHPKAWEFTKEQLIEAGVK